MCVSISHVCAYVSMCADMCRFPSHSRTRGFCMSSSRTCPSFSLLSVLMCLGFLDSRKTTGCFDLDFDYKEEPFCQWGIGTPSPWGILLSCPIFLAHRGTSGSLQSMPPPSAPCGTSLDIISFSPARLGMCISVTNVLQPPLLVVPKEATSLLGDSIGAK